LNVEYGFNIDWIIKLNEDLCVEILNSPLNVMGNLCEIPLVSMVIEATKDLARCNVNATVIPGGSTPYCTCRNLVQSCKRHLL